MRPQNWREHLRHGNPRQALLDEHLANGAGDIDPGRVHLGPPALAPHYRGLRLRVAIQGAHYGGYSARRQEQIAALVDAAAAHALALF